MQCLFLVKKRNSSYGVSFGLLNSATFLVDFLNKEGIHSKIIQVNDANDIDREVYNANPKIVFIEALYCSPVKLKEIIHLKHHKGRKWVIRIHSKLPFLANEGMAIEWIKQYQNLGSNVYIAPNTKELTDDIEKNAIYLPNVYLPQHYSCERTKLPHFKTCGITNIGCFGAVRVLKNTLIQAVAAIQYGEIMGETIHFHINGDCVESGGSNVMKNLEALFKNSKHKLITHPWSDHENFIKLINKMDIGLQVSLSESFNIVAADFVYSGIPIVVSPDIDWMPDYFVANPNSSKSIVRTILRVEGSSKTHEARKALDEYNDIATFWWFLFLEKVL